MLKHLKAFIRAHFMWTLLGLVILIVVDGLQLVTPELLGRLADQLTERSLTANQLYGYMAGIGLIAVVIAIGRYWWRILINGTARKMEYWLRNQLFLKLESLSWEYFSKHRVGDLMALATNDVTAVGQAAGVGLVMLVDALFLTIMTTVLMSVNIDPQLTMVAVLPLPFIALLMLFGGKLLRGRFKKVQEAFSHMTDQVQESFSGVRIIKTYTREDHHRNLFRKTNQENFDENMKLIKLWGMVFPMVKTISSVSLVLTLLYGGTMVMKDQISVGDFVAFISYIGILTWPMMAVGWVVNTMERGAASLGRINDFLDLEPEFEFGMDAIVNADEDGPVIRVENLSFHYPTSEQEVLSQVSFEIYRGQKIGVIGRTGSGKTTLVNLLMRAWDCSDQTIFIEGQSIETLSKHAIKGYFAMVPQDNFLFSRNIEENIQFFEEQLRFDQVEAAAQIANVHEEILSFQEGYNTLLGERGVNLSGGQKQRISIARALLKRGEVLILDDALSAVDTKTEEAILRHLREALADRTAIIIAHRISAIKDCDQILVIDEGRIVAKGSHSELISFEGLYKELFEKQQLEEKIEGE